MSSTLRQRAPSPGKAEKAQLIKNAEEKELTEGERFIVPNFTVKQLLDAIPAHCFHRSAIRSGRYVIQDYAAIALGVYLTFQIDPFLSKFNISPITYTIAKISLYALYTVYAGLFGTGLWIIGHECGHQAFSSSKTINNSVGWVLHSFLLVPYQAWRISHGRHHAATGHLTRDEVHVPRTRKEHGYPAMKEEAEILGFGVSEARQSELREALDDAPIVTLYNLVIHQLFGWPAYLFNNASGQLHYPAGTNHFDPAAVIFKPQQRGQIIRSNIGILLMVSALAYWSYARSFSEMAVLYGIPYLFVNHWLVFITYLQHTDPLIPHYSANSWTFARGALATVDRTFLGPIGAYVLHGICETHVAHHTSSKIPHYNAWEATEALKNFLGPHYQKSDENMLLAFYRTYRDCKYIDAGEDIVFFKNSSGLAKKYAVEEAGGISDSGIDMAESK
ncbi:hypothetical protein P7C73_g564, partial [Tremellales sp. Uapishka_1]